MRVGFEGDTVDIQSHGFRPGDIQAKIAQENSGCFQIEPEGKVENLLDALEKSSKLIRYFGRPQHGSDCRLLHVDVPFMVLNKSRESRQRFRVKVLQLVHFAPPGHPLFRVNMTVQTALSVFSRLYIQKVLDPGTLITGQSRFHGPLGWGVFFEITDGFVDEISDIDLG